MNEERKPIIGDILVQMTGYSMILYQFNEVVRMNESNTWYRRCKKYVVHESPDGYYGHPTVSCVVDPDARVFRRSNKTYMGKIWDGKPLTEDHMD